MIDIDEFIYDGTIIWDKEAQWEMECFISSNNHDQVRTQKKFSRGGG